MRSYLELKDLVVSSLLSKNTFSFDRMVNAICQCQVNGFTASFDATNARTDPDDRVAFNSAGGHSQCMQLKKIFEFLFDSDQGQAKTTTILFCVISSLLYRNDAAFISRSNPRESINKINENVRTVCSSRAAAMGWFNLFLFVAVLI